MVLYIRTSGVQAAQVGAKRLRLVSLDYEPSQTEGGPFMRNGVIIDENDNVVVAIHELEAGTDVAYPLPGGGEGHVVTREHIPLFHKIARTDIKRGEKVMKYGEYIGVATADIAAGEHVHTHNCASSDELKDTDANDVASAASDVISPAAAPESTRTFRGYRRADGQVGIRNHVLVLPTSICASDTTERIARAVTGCVTFHNQNGCSQVNVDQQLTIDTLAGLAANPNVYAVLAVSLGCEGCQNDLVVDAIRKRTNKPIRSLIIQEVGGSIKAVDEGTRIARELVREASLCEREDVPVSELIFGTNCGGSDTSSGLGSNPLIGEVSDWLVAQGATTVLCETPELFGGEHILARRAATPEVGEQILKIVRDYEKYVQSFGAEMREGNPAPATWRAVSRPSRRSPSAASTRRVTAPSTPSIPMRRSSRATRASLSWTRRATIPPAWAASSPAAASSSSSPPAWARPRATPSRRCCASRPTVARPRPWPTTSTPMFRRRSMAPRQWSSCATS